MCIYIWYTTYIYICIYIWYTLYMYVHTYYTQYIVPIFSQTSLRKLAMDCFPKLLDPTESFLCCLSLTVGVKATTGDDRWRPVDDRWRPVTMALSEVFWDPKIAIRCLESLWWFSWTIPKFFHLEPMDHNWYPHDLGNRRFYRILIC